MRLRGAPYWNRRGSSRAILRLRSERVRRPQLCVAIEHAHAHARPRAVAALVHVHALAVRRPVVEPVEHDLAGLTAPLDRHARIPMEIVRQHRVLTEDAHGDTEEAYHRPL